MSEWMNDVFFLLTCDKKLTKSQLSPTHASTKRKITDELKHNAGWYEVREGHCHWRYVACIQARWDDAVVGSRWRSRRRLVSNVRTKIACTIDTATQTVHRRLRSHRIQLPPPRYSLWHERLDTQCKLFTKLTNYKLMHHTTMANNIIYLYSIIYLKFI